jgi:tetratricopeptide (TPR) repeat protein
VLEKPSPVTGGAAKVELDCRPWPARELEFATAQTVYTPEFMTNASVLRDWVLLQDSASDAIAAFEDALQRIPAQGRAHLGLGLAYRAIRRDVEAALEFERAGAAIARLDAMGRRSEAALVHACQLVIDQRDDEAATALEQALATAAPGPFGWSIPVEPFLARAVNSPVFARVRAILAERAS